MNYNGTESAEAAHESEAAEATATATAGNHVVISLFILSNRRMQKTPRLRLQSFQVQKAIMRCSTMLYESRRVDRICVFGAAECAIDETYANVSTS